SEVVTASTPAPTTAPVARAPPPTTAPAVPTAAPTRQPCSISAPARRAASAALRETMVLIGRLPAPARSARDRPALSGADGGRRGVRTPDPLGVNEVL